MLKFISTLWVCLFAMDAAANEAEYLSTNKDWDVYTAQSPKECWVRSTPKKTVNTRDGKVVSVRRGDIYIIVAYRPSENVKAEVSFNGGYPFAEGSTVDLEIDGKTYKLFPTDEYAWPASSDEDHKIVTAMKRGSDAVVTARSQRGTITKDTFSLLGFTASMEKARKLC